MAKIDEIKAARKIKDPTERMQKLKSIIENYEKEKRRPEKTKRN
jgi:hypothetical protein